MLKTYPILLGICLMFLLACQNKVDRPQPLLKNNNNNISTSPFEPKPNSSNKDPFEPKEVAAKRAQALAILNFRLKNDPDFYTLMTEGVWNLQFVHSGEMSKPGEYDGVWYDFKEDHTYEYGKGPKVNGSGKYNYHFERAELLMVDNDSSKKPDEWSIKSSGDVIIMVGTATYNDNHMQKKFVNQPDSFRQ